MPIITSWTIYKDSFCTNYLSWTQYETCDRWTTIYSLSKQDVSELGASVLFNASSMIVILFAIVYVLKIIFRKLFR